MAGKFTYYLKSATARRGREQGAAARHTDATAHTQKQKG